MRIQANIPFYIFLILIAFLGFLLSLFIQESISLNVFISFIAIGGFLLSSYLIYIKRGGKPLICPTGSNCNTVIYSEYSKFFGIPLEYLGAFYFSVIFASYTMLAISPGSLSGTVTLAIFALTVGAFLFSLYLTSIQAFFLKQWCMWCLLSAVLSISIFVISLGKFAAGISFLTSAYDALSATHLMAFAIGVGGATITAVLFFRFLRDFKISNFEMSVIKTISQVIWFSLAVLLITEFALYLVNPVELNNSAQFLTKILVLAAVVVIGVIINLVILPRLVVMSFKDKNMHSEFLRLRKITFGLGAIMMTSWYFAFVMDVVPSISTEFPTLITTYGALLIASAGIGQIVEHQVSKGRTHRKETH